MQMIVLHNRFSNEPIIIRIDAINAIEKKIDRIDDSKEEYSEISVSNMYYEVKEHIGAVMTRIKYAEKGAKDGDTDQHTRRRI